MNQTEEKKYCITSFICGIKKNDTNGLIYETNSQTQNKLSYQGEEWGEGIVMEFGIDKHILLYLKWITIKDLLYSTRIFHVTT